MGKTSLIPEIKAWLDTMANRSIRRTMRKKVEEMLEGTDEDYQRQVLASLQDEETKERGAQRHDTANRKKSGAQKIRDQFPQAEASATAAGANQTFNNRK